VRYLRPSLGGLYCETI